jgi:hypothetical protein
MGETVGKASGRTLSSNKHSRFRPLLESILGGVLLSPEHANSAAFRCLEERFSLGRLRSSDFILPSLLCKTFPGPLGNNALQFHLQKETRHLPGIEPALPNDHVNVKR